MRQAFVVVWLLGVLASPAAAQERFPGDHLGRVELGVAFGFAHQTEMWMAGLRGGVRGIGYRDIEAAATLLAGLASEHYTARLSIHGRFVVPAGDFRFYPLVGPGLYFYTPRGRFAEWCDKLQLDDCGGFGLGVEAGLGLGWRAMAFEAYLGTGPLPLLSLLLSGSLEL